MNQRSRATNDRQSALQLNSDPLASRRRVLLAQEAARKNAAARLHGLVQNRLLVASQWLAMAQQAFSKDPSKAQELLQRASALIQDVNETELRQLCRDLYPSLLKLSLTAALDSLAGHIASECTLELSIGQGAAALEGGGKSRLAEDIRVAAYRSLSHAISFVMGAQGATEARLAIDVPEDGWLEAELSWTGSSLTHIAPDADLDLNLAQDYADTVGGSLRVEELLRDKGRILVSFPIATEPPPSY